MFIEILGTSKINWILLNSLSETDIAQMCCKVIITHYSNVRAATCFSFW